ncbi:SMI1/KNR4 family protein [Flavobacterium covae]|nr:SMI1/KNR4 family protein [Flavobacterium covae]
MKENIDNIEKELNLILPKNYLNFLETIKLDEVFEINNTGIYLYSASDLLERNITYEVQEYEPNYFLIGQDGDLGYFIKNNEEIIYSNDLGAVGSLDMVFVSDSIEGLLNINK